MSNDPDACEKCGATTPDVETVRDPYVHDLYDETRLITVCRECLQQRLDDI